MDSYHFFGYLSTYTTLIPLAAGFSRFNRLIQRHRFFLFYILYGFLSDVFKPSMGSEEMKKWMYHVFVLVETTFLIWFMSQVTEKIILKKILVASIFFFIAFWFITRFFIAAESTAYSPMFDMLCAVYISSMAAILLINMAQRHDEILTEPDFWFLTGTFIYFFCANFIFGLLGTDIYQKIWFIVNCLNVISYLIFTKAFLTAARTSLVRN